MKHLQKVFFSLLLILVSFQSCKKDEEEQDITNKPIVTEDTIPEPQDTLSDLVINVTELENSNGNVNVALYNVEVDFNNPPTPFREITIQANSPITTITISDLPPGEWAFAVYHDENSNLEIDQNFLGIPQEGFAFSNNAFGSFAPPSWEQSKFEIPKSTIVTQTVSLIFF